MHENVTFPISNIVLIDRIKKDYGYFDFLFGKIGGKTKDFQKIVKNDLVSKEQFVDFSSTYFEGTKPELGALGYHFDHIFNVAKKVLGEGSILIYYDGKKPSGKLYKVIKICFT